MKRKQNRSHRAKTAPHRLRHQPRSVPVLQGDAEDPAPDQPFKEGAGDALSADLRHRLISETAFHHLAERGFEEGNEVEDWTEAEGEVDHTLLNPPGASR